MSTRKSRLKRVVVWWIGWVFILLGILGLFLLFLQAILFLLIGLSLLSGSSPWADRLLQKLKTRFPKISGTLEQAKERSTKIIGKLTSRFSRSNDRRAVRRGKSQAENS